MKLKDMTDRELILFNIGETRGIKNILNNHLHHHEKQDDRRWKLYIGLILAAVSFCGALVLVLI